MHLNEWNFENILKNTSECPIPELDCEKFFENYYSSVIDEEAPILTDQFSPVNRMDSVEERSFVYEEIKGDRMDLKGLMAADYFVQGGLLLAIAVWIYPLPSVWRQEK